MGAHIYIQNQTAMILEIVRYRRACRQNISYLLMSLGGAAGIEALMKYGRLESKDVHVPWSFHAPDFLWQLFEAKIG